MVVLSNEIHLAAATGCVITCPLVPGEILSGPMAMVVTVPQPAGVVLPELVRWLPLTALDEPIGNSGAAARTRNDDDRDSPCLLTDDPAGPEIRCSDQLATGDGGWVAPGLVGAVGRRTTRVYLWSAAGYSRWRGGRPPARGEDGLPVTALHEGPGV